MPRVSVIIPTFNSARFLGQAISTALSQTYTDYEVIVVDDGSTDGTRDVIAQFGAKIHYLYQPNRGLSSARNLALSKASGEFIAYLDADDMWYPHKLEKQVIFLDAYKECGLVHTEMTTIDEMDKPIHLQFNEESRREIPQGHWTMDLLQRCHIQIATVLERRECIERIGKFDERLKTVQDYLHWILVPMEGMAFGYIPEPLAMYRWRAGSLSSSQVRVLEDYLVMYHILLGDKCLALRCGQEAADIVHDRLYALGRELAYLHRIEGRTDQSFRHVINLIWKWPVRIDLYVDLLKTCIPPPLAAKLRLLKTQFS